MQDLSFDHIIALHNSIIARDGGDLRSLSEANLHQLTFQANLIPEIFPRAAYCFYSLVAYPVFREGNIRTAKELILAILKKEGFTLDPADHEVLFGMAEAIRNFAVDPEDVEIWLATRAKKV